MPYTVFNYLERLNWCQSIYSITAINRPVTTFFISAQSSLANGRIAVLSPLATEHGFVRSWPPSNNGSLDPLESDPKRHLDRFRCFCIAHSCAKHRHTQTLVHVTCDICNNRPQKRPNNIVCWNHRQCSYFITNTTPTPTALAFFLFLSSEA